jgi:hypothetical protein
MVEENLLSDNVGGSSIACAIGASGCWPWNFEVILDERKPRVSCSKS